MQDIVAKLQEILSSDSGKQKLNEVASMLGVGSNNGGNNSVDLSNLSNLLSQNNMQNDNQNNNDNNFDISSLMNMLNNSNNNQNFNADNNFDISNLSQMLGGLNNNSNNNEGGNNNFDLSALSGLFSGGNSSDNPVGNIDINMIMKLQSIMSTMNQENQNTSLLKALKPHFKEKRQNKIDNAIRIMQLVSVWPALKESGILGGLGGLFGGGK